MPIFLDCPSGHRLKVPSKLAGHAIVCPVCEARVAVPRPEAPSTTTERKRHTSQNRSKPPKRKASEPKRDASVSDMQQTVAPQVHSEALPTIESDLRSQTERTLPETPFPNSQSTTEALLRSSDEEEPQAPPNDELAASDFSPEQVALLEKVATESDESLSWVFEVDPIPQRYDTTKKSLPENQRFGTLALGIAAILVAVFCAIPSVMDQILARQAGTNPPDNWTYFVLLASVIQIAVALYAMRLPDWSTAWFGSLTATAFAAMYALGLALTMFANQEHQLVQKLGLLDEAFHHQAQPWCFLIMCITLILAFCYGRFSLRWYHLEKQLAASQQ